MGAFKFGLETDLKLNEKVECKRPNALVHVINLVILSINFLINVYYKHFCTMVMQYYGEIKGPIYQSTVL